MSDVAIYVENLSKRYRIGQRERYKALRDTLTDMVYAPFRMMGSMLHGRWSAVSSQKEHNYIWALKDVSFDVRRGEVIGIIGRNGSGKSTLLKILSRITVPTEGQARIYGRVGSLLEVGTGFHPELTGRENIYLNGAILGMQKVEIERKFDEIVAFAEIEKFIDTPVKRYSSGMYVRLAFAVAAHMEPEILLVDEVLAVGDAAFQKKCLGKMGDVAKAGRTVLFVSHNMGSVKMLCTSAMLLDFGQKICSGSVDDVVDFYLRTFVSEGSPRDIAPSMHQDGTGELLIDMVTVENDTGEPVSHVRINEPITITIKFSVKEPVRDVRIGLGFNTLSGIRVATLHHTDEGFETFDGDIGTYEISFFLLNPLLTDTYVISAGAHRAFGGQTIDYVPEALKFDVVDLSTDEYIHEMHNPGIIQLNGRWKAAKRIG